MGNVQPLRSVYVARQGLLQLQSVVSREALHGRGIGSVGPQSGCIPSFQQTWASAELTGMLLSG